MCGIAGFFGRTGEDRTRLVKDISQVLSHRGPDSAGEWSDPKSALTLIHRRLAILDLSADGHQPMHSADDRYVTVYNGEIYNFQALKEELSKAGHSFRGTSDTEILLAGVREWGMSSFLERSRGMFAFAIWDKHKNEMWLARDRMGEKPLYYGWINGRLCFASELKALKILADGGMSLSQEALSRYLRFGRVHSPLSIYEGLYKLPPGSYLHLKLDSCLTGPRNFSPHVGKNSLHPVRYWNPSLIYKNSLESDLIDDMDEGAEQVEAVLSDSVAKQMIADVPLGAFLSGGIDSSLVVSLMQKQSQRPINTFTIGFDAPEYDEAPYAKEIAKYLGTSHEEMYVSPSEVINLVPQLPAIFDEPIADQSQVPTFLISKLARAHVTVCLSGDGGDELFGGYERHIFAEKIWSLIRTAPGVFRKGTKIFLLSLSPNAWSNVAGAMLRAGGRQATVKHVGAKLHKMASLIDATSEEDLYAKFCSHWTDPAKIFRYESEKDPFTNFSEGWPTEGTIAQKFMLADLTHYLPDTILVKLDRASMAVSLESRAPFLDHRLVELSFRLHPSLKIQAGRGKRILRRVLGKYLPSELTERPKSGFSMPIAQWLRGPLRGWAEELLDADSIKKAGIFDVKRVRRCLSDHMKGSRDNHNQLWNLLMFEAWRQKA